MNEERKRRVKISSRKPTVLSLLRISFVILGLAICSAAYPQSNVTINLSNVTVEDVFNAINSQTGYTVAYHNSDVDLKKKVSVNVQNGSVGEVVKQALTGQNVAFSITDKHVVLSKQAASSNGNKIKVSGKITDVNGDGLIGASVTEKGSANGAIADVDGDFSLSVPSNATLSISYIGYNSKDVQVNGNTVINVTLTENSKVLEEVVVTALGIRKKEKSLTYATQIVEGDELTRVKDPNLITTLAGKTAGVQINKSAGGLGGSAKVIIRGNRSLAGNNQPLYVIDGIPLNNDITDLTATSIGGTADAANRDTGDGISNLNPDDIESLNILKGPAASALYGSAAANGVILITTKKGKAGITSITFNTSTTIDNAAYGIPEFQNSYTGVTSSWGSKISGSPDYVKDFFRTGVTTVNSLSMNMGSDMMQTYFSYANTYGQGVIDQNSLSKHNFNFREVANFFDKKLTLDANVNLLYQKLNNATAAGGYYMNPLVGLYHFPRGGVEGGKSFDYYKNNYSILDEERNIWVQNWYAGLSDMDQNPYWLINRSPSDDIRARAISSLSLNYKMSDSFSLQARGNADFISDKFKQGMYVGTFASIVGNNGRFIYFEQTNLSTYGDIMLSYQGALSDDFALGAHLGSSIQDSQVKNLRLDSHIGGEHEGLFLPNVFTVGNMNLNETQINQLDYHSQQQSVFFSGQLGFKDWLFLDATARNEWHSSLAYTNSAKKGFFFPSLGLTWVLNESLALPKWVNLGKLRGAWAEVGNGLPGQYISNPTNQVPHYGAYVENTTAPFTDLKPEITRSIELGTEWRLLGNRVDFDFTYYKSNTKDQFFQMPAPAGADYSVYYVNAGDIENKGVEIVLGGSPVLTQDFRWKTSFNFATNKNKVIKLVDGLDYFAVGQQNSSNYQMRLYEGGSVGDIYGVGFKRDAQGNIVYDANGLPVGDTESDYVKIANCAPDWNLGWSNTFTYKGFSLFFLIDGRFGGKVLSITQADLDAFGVTKATGDARNAGSVSFDGRKINDVQAFYQMVGGRAGITENYVYDATNIRLRELSLGYAIPKKIFGENSVFNGGEIAIIGRNLFFLKNNAPYDPDATLSTGNNLQGIDVFGMPTNRSFGVNLKLKF